MKTTTLLSLFFLMGMVACSKEDDTSDYDRNCGTIITLTKRGDGGVQEKIAISTCGPDFTAYEGVEMPLALKFYKGQTRPAATYLVATSTDTVYIRYESGNVPQATVDSFVNLGYSTQNETLTGLEHTKWP